MERNSRRRRSSHRRRSPRCMGIRLQPWWLMWYWLTWKLCLIKCALGKGYTGILCLLLVLILWWRGSLLMYPSIAKACEVSAVPFAAFRRVPCSTSAWHVWHTCTTEKAGIQQSGLGYYGPIKHLDVHASQLLDPRVVSRRMICGAFGWSFSACGLWAADRQKAYQGLWGSQACCGPCAYLGLLCVDLDTSLVFANAWRWDDGMM